MKLTDLIYESGVTEPATATVATVATQTGTVAKVAGVAVATLEGAKTDATHRCTSCQFLEPPAQCYRTATPETIGQPDTPGCPAWSARHTEPPRPATEAEKAALLALFPAGPPSTSPTYPPSPCPTLGGRWWWSQAGAPWVCGTCSPPPTAGPFDSLTLAPASPADRSGTILPASTNHPTNAPQSPEWTGSELERQRLVLQGKTVVANQHKDLALIAWAKDCGLFVDIGREPNGRLTFWGNPYRQHYRGQQRDGTRDEVCDKYQNDLPNHPEKLARIPELRGKVLGCYCYPQRCHGDHLAELANAPVDVHCGDCRHFLKDPIGDGSGIGNCAAGVKGALFPSQTRRCRKFQAR